MKSQNRVSPVVHLAVNERISGLNAISLHGLYFSQRPWSMALNNNKSSGSDLSTRRRIFAASVHSPLAAWLVLGFSVLLTISAYFVSLQLVERRLQDRFDFRVHEIGQAIEERLFIYEQILWGGVALFHASPERVVGREQWANYVETLNIDRHWPGIQGMGYSIPVTPDEKSVHEQGIQAEGFRDYQIKPEGERDAYSAIVYLEPFDWRNKRAFGYDMWSNDMRREAMARARDEGLAASSGIITLVQETDSDVQRGFLVYVPVYRGRETPTTVFERRKKFQGWVYAPFRAANLMAGILGSSDRDLVFDIYDGVEPGAENLLYSSERASENTVDSPLFSQTQALALLGHRWTIAFRTPADVNINDDSSVPSMVVAVGLIVDGLLFYVILSLHYINRRAQGIAEEMTEKLQTAKEGLQKEVSVRTEELRIAHESLESDIQTQTKTLRDKIHELEKMNNLTSGREMRIIELKQEVNVLVISQGEKPPYGMENDELDSHTTKVSMTSE